MPCTRARLPRRLGRGQRPGQFGGRRRGVDIGGPGRGRRDHRGRGTAIANGDSVATEEGGAAIVAAALDAFGQVDVLVNNAGILRDAAFKNMTAEQVDAVIAVHLSGAFHVTRAVWPIMRAQNYGRIVQTTSGTGLSEISVRPTTAPPRWAWSA